MLFLLKKIRGQISFDFILAATIFILLSTILVSAFTNYPEKLEEANKKELIIQTYDKIYNFLAVSKDLNATLKLTLPKIDGCEVIIKPTSIFIGTADFNISGPAGGKELREQCDGQRIVVMPK